MSHRASGGTPAQRAKAAFTSALEWHDARPRASMRTARGWVWAALVAALFFWMSNPLLYVTTFYIALDKALFWTAVAVVVSLPWLRLPRVPWPWLVFLGVCLLSQLWTIYDPATDQSIKVYAQIALVSVMVAANCRADVVCWGMGAGGVLITGLSLLAYRQERPGSFYLSMGTDGVVDKVLAGVGTNENILAYTLVVSLGATLALGLPAGLARRAVWVAVLGVHAFGLYLADSGTGYQTAVALAIAAAAVVAGPRLAAGHSRRVVAGTAISAIALLGISLVAVAKVLGKDILSFSGRADFWRATISATLDQAPVLGSGWGAVWEHPWNPTYPNYVSQEIYDRAGYALSHGHNFFIDVLPELGLLGVACAVILVVYVIREIVRCGLRAGGADPLGGRLNLMVLVALLVSGVTEPMLTVPLGWWSLLLVASTSRQRERPERVSALRRQDSPERQDPPASGAMS